MDMLERGLPKWPQMIVTGQSVTRERAMEIIRRTDVFFEWSPLGNNREFNDAVERLTEFPNVTKLVANGGAFEDALELKRQWDERWGRVPLSFVKNDWISSPFITGPHGWMHPDGTVGYSDNIGKWPTTEEVLDDWVKIAEAFPDLELEATVMDESVSMDGNGETSPVVSYMVSGGKVEVADPLVRDIHAERGRSRDAWKDERKKVKVDLARLVFGRKNGFENAIPLEEIASWSRFAKP